MSLQIAGIDVLGTERIRVWRWFRLFRAIKRAWQRLILVDCDRRLVVVHIDTAQQSLPEQCRSSAMPCVTCGRLMGLPNMPSNQYSRTTFECASCHTYYFLDTQENPEVYDELRRKLAQKAAA